MKRIYTDFLRVGILLVLVGALLYWLDESNIVVFQAQLIGLFLIGGTHLTRRILFPQLNLQAIAKKAYEDNNIAAALVFLTVVAFLIAVMFLSMRVLN